MDVRPGYKLTEVGPIPEDWNLATIGAVAETSSGTTPSRALADRYYRNGHVAWVKTLDLNNSQIFRTEEQVTSAALNETSLRCYPSGSVVVAMYGGFNQIGRTGLLRIPATVNQALTAVRPDSRRLRSEYLLSVLNFRAAYWKSVASSSRRDPNITGKDVRKFPLALPDVKEQEAIAEALNDADSLIDSLEQLLVKKRQIVQGAMQALVAGRKRLAGFEVRPGYKETEVGVIPEDWEVKPLGVLATLYQPTTISAKELTDSGFPVYGANGIVGFYGRSNHDTWQVTVTCRGSTCGTVNRTVDRCWITGNAMVLNCDTNELLSKEFFYYLLCSQDFSDCITGTGQPQIVRSPLSAFVVPLPSTTAEQAAIAAVLRDMDTEIAALEAKLAKARQIKHGMMQELLTGRIRLV